MPLTILDPRTALIVVDLQNGIVSLPVAHPITAVVENSRRLAEAFRRRSLPVVLVNVDGAAPGRTEENRPKMQFPEGWTELVPELGQQPDDICVTKKSWGAFATTDLEHKLKTLGITQVVLTGVATSIGVESTARQAYDQGFNLTFATDAMTDRTAEAHERSIHDVFPRIGERGSTDEIIALLERS